MQEEQNQNYSYRVDYAFDNNTFVSGYISEADDPYYRKIKNSNNLGQKIFGEIILFLLVGK